MDLCVFTRFENGKNVLLLLLTWAESLLSSPQVLKGSKKLCLSVRSVGRIPGGYVTNHVYTWVDPQGRSVSPPPDLPEHRSATLRRTDSQRRSNMQLLQDGDEKKVKQNIGLLDYLSSVCITSSN